MFFRIQNVHMILSMPMQNVYNMIKYIYTSQIYKSGKEERYEK